jgi:hypothetical protein
MSEPTLAELLAAVQGLRADMAAIGSRLDALESRQRELEKDLLESVEPQTLVLLAAAITSYLGRPVRVRSARRVLPPVTPEWARFGRAAAQQSALHLHRRG